MAQKDLTVIIGRFSPLHNGHVYLINKAIESSKAVTILIGSSGQARTTKNPFTFEERRDMIEAHIKSLTSVIKTVKAGSSIKLLPSIVIKPIYDRMYNDQMWITGVQDEIASSVLEHERVLCTRINDIYLTGSDRDRSTWYLNAFGNLYKDGRLPPVDFLLSATEIRDILFSGGPRDKISKNVPASTEKFLEKFSKSDTFDDLKREYDYLVKYQALYAGLRYPVSIQTVDTCVIQSGHVLVVERDNFPGRGLWCLPGGHLDVDKHERLIDAAIRELQEETRIALSKAQLYGSIRAEKCFDHPDRSLKARVITMCYLLKLDDTKELPKIKPQRGEARRVMWVPIAEALGNRSRWFDDHHSILEWGVGHI